MEITIRDILIAVGSYFIGSLFTWDLIKRYKKAQGYDPDPLDGVEKCKIRGVCDRCHKK